MSTELSKNAHMLLVQMYKVYLESIEAGKSRQAAKHMGGSKEIRDRIMPNADEATVVDLCYELKRAGYLAYQPGDDVIYLASLTGEAIAYLENRFKNGFLEVLDVVSKFIP